MTVILLDTIFIAALSRAFDIATDTAVSSIHQDCGEVHSCGTLTETNSTNGALMLSLSTSEDDTSLSLERRTIFSLTRGQIEVGSILDAFAATYHAAYRYIMQLLSLCKCTFRD